MTDKELFENCYQIGIELLKNAAHSSGIDFQRLNLTMVELDERKKQNDKQ